MSSQQPQPIFGHSDTKQVFLLKLPNQIYDQLHEFNDQLIEKGGEEIEIGELLVQDIAFIEQNELTKMEFAESELVPRLWINKGSTDQKFEMVMNNQPLDENACEAIVSENLKHDKSKDHKMKVQTLVTHKFNCVPGSAQSYQLSKESKETLFQTNKQEISQIKTQSANQNEEIYPLFKNKEKEGDSTLLSDKFSYEPIICNVKEINQSSRQKDKQDKKVKKQMKNTLAFYQDEFQDQPNDPLSYEQIELEKESYKKSGAYRSMRVSLSKNQLITNLLELFRNRPEYKLNELVEILDHPVLPLKEALKDLAEYDTKRRVYQLRSTFRA